MTDSSAEAAIDRAVMRRLSTDREYIHAEDAESQATREAKITEEEEQRYYERTRSRESQ